MRMATTPVYDVIVIGAGIEGSSSAYNLVKNGQRVLLLEQFQLPHTRGSSHGQSRISSHMSKSKVCVRMMVDAFSMWDILEEEYGKTLFTQTGSVDIRQLGSPGSQALTDALRSQAVPYEIISPKDFRLRFPMFKVDSNVGGVSNPTAGILRADRALAAFQTIFQKLGGTLMDGCPVSEVIPGNNVKIVTPQAIYLAKSVVVAAGPWTGKITSALGLNTPLQPCRATVFYWKSKEGQENLHSYKNMPTFLDCSTTDDHYLCYGLPDLEYPGLVKVCLHAGPPCDPDHRDQADTRGVQERAVKEIKRLLPGLESKPSVIEHCIVTKTPDDFPYIGKHPMYPNIIIAAGFSGYGFKLAPAVGKAVTELVMDSSMSYDMSLFRVDRFHIKPKL